MTESENLPVQWQEQMKANAKSLLETERPAMSIMSLKSGQMSIGGEAVPGNEIDAIIVASVTEMAWFKDRYDPDVKANPACYALGEGKAETLVPHEAVEEKQADACVNCEKFEWGSDPGGGRGKACKEKRRLFLIPADGSAESVLLSIPPTSLKNWANYAREIVVTTGMTPAGVVTKIKVVPSAKNQFEVKFSKVGDVPEHVVPKIVSKFAEALETMTAPYPPIEEEAKPAKKRKF
jgi:hypothetical protein